MVESAAVRRRAEKLTGADLTTFSREEFITEVFDYKPGDHVTILAPSGGGKTHLGFQLLGQTASPDLQGVVFVMKEKDATVSRFAKRFGFRIVRDWPPGPGAKLQKKPPGWVLWVRDSADLDGDEARHRSIFKRALQMLYRPRSRPNRNKPVIIFADETYSLEHELNLTKDVVRVETKGRALECGMWNASQRAAYINRWAYQATHLFLGFDPDAESQKRLSEIGGGVDPEIVRAALEKLTVHQFIYIHRDDRTMCIVDA